MEADTLELKKTVKELSRKVKTDSIAALFFGKIQIVLLTLTPCPGEEATSAFEENYCGSSLRFVHQLSQPNQCHARLCGAGQKTGEFEFENLLLVLVKFRKQLKSPCIWDVRAANTLEISFSQSSAFARSNGEDKWTRQAAHSIFARCK